MTEKFSLKKKFSLITGASGLLGYEHSHALLEIQSDLILTDVDMNQLTINKKKLQKKFPNSKILIFKMDVTNERSIKSVITKIKKDRINLHVLINNAAIDSKVLKSNKMTNTGKLENLSTEIWNKHLSVGLTGYLNCTKLFGSILKKSYNHRGGVILNIASDLSVIAPNHSIYPKGIYKPVTYSVIKHGIVGLTKYVSTYWNKEKIRCNSLSPGPIFNNQSKTFIKKLSKQIPMGRLANKSEYRQAIKFLCSDASSYMTGQNVVIDGGRSVW